MVEQESKQDRPESVERILEEAIRLLLAKDAGRLSGLLARVEYGQLPQAAGHGERVVPKMLMLASLLARTRRNLRLLGREGGAVDRGYSR
ncbi:hypothetical protein [Silvibacterium acidisoli]|uniref:hypothetical protein n=1 Tax=Acidobacteriaceae bacterium ZG23-2 TaxID=2883246 RepID=UPI00406C81CD